MHSTCNFIFLYFQQEFGGNNEAVKMAVNAHHGMVMHTCNLHNNFHRNCTYTCTYIHREYSHVKGEEQRGHEIVL